MSERILKALMQLFALVADVDELTNKSRIIVELFLKQQLSQDMVEEYLTIYDEYLEVHHKVSQKKEGKKKRTSLNSVKVLKICTQINTELTQRQKVVVLIRLIEYVNSDQNINEQELEFVDTVAESFNISKEEFNNCLSFITCNDNNIPTHPNIIIINNKKEEFNPESYKHIYSDTIEGVISVLNISSVGMFIMKYFGHSEIQLNGQAISINRTYILTQGSSLRSTKLKPIYYSDIINRFLSDHTQSKIIFTADHIEYMFKGGKYGLHNLTFSEESGKLLGVMGGSGAGKSTLLNVLNGNSLPSKGKVTVNNVDIHREKDNIEGVIGYVSQDDLLIEELTVFQNVFYNAKLCFDGENDEQIKERSLKLLNSLGLSETRDLKVGSPMEKTISGGQRKRLNIGLELIREPSVLFVDEPTSGLSSRDSENIMDLLKELALKGKIVFVVIHQPSSDIFKMFDKLLILDLGGYPIYYGNPVDAVIYFKKLVNHVNADESECGTCGNVNPEQIFNIIESKVLDEYGNLTDNRKVSPKEWNEYYHEHIVKDIHVIEDSTAVPEINFKIPSKFGQFKVFLVRDVLSKLTNKQYLLINLLEAPILALILGFFVKFYHTDATNQVGYIFRENENIIAYIFMAVVVALFIGLTVSAEEIIRDQRIRKRESFLNLSNISYLLSKIVIMFSLSAIQTFTFIVIGNTMLEIQDMYSDYWLILFSTACFANMLGLNISSTFNSAVTIYILIPFLIIPQLLFSGLIIKFEKLNPVITSQSYVPFIGDVMASRWAFEAMAVNQFKNNKFDKGFYHFEKLISIAEFKNGYWMNEIKKKVTIVENHLSKNDNQKEFESAVALLNHEINKEGKLINFPFENLDKLNPQDIDISSVKNLNKYLGKINKYYIKLKKQNFDAKDEVINKYNKSKEGKEAFLKLKNDYSNTSLSDLVTNRAETNLIQEIDGKLIQRSKPVYLDPIEFRAHFFAPTKIFMGKRYDTFWYNITMLWFMTVVLGITLYFDLFKKILNIFDR
jgi:ABC transport system ATP-binding/permease protein